MAANQPRRHYDTKKKIKNTLCLGDFVASNVFSFPRSLRGDAYRNTERKDIMSIQPEGEDLRKAVKWVSEERKFNPGKDLNQLVEAACLKFDLKPADADFLSRFVVENEA
jgi:hypothetical protein